MSEPRSSWLESREPRPPEPLARALAGVPDDSARALAESGFAALRRALALGDARAAAYELLAADALLTYAIERAAEAGVDALSAQLDELSPAAFGALVGGQG